MKTKTKKLFLSLFAFASLAITACSGNNGGSSGAGDSSGSQTTSSESSSGSNTSTTSEADVDTNLYVKVDNGEEQTIAYDEDEGTYTIGPVELTTSQVIEIYIKEDGVKQSALDIIDVETGSAAYLDVDEDEGTVSVTSDGTYTFVFTYDDGELSLAITKEAEPTTYSATLTEGDLGTNLLVHVYNYDGGVIDVVPTINSKTVSFLVDNPTLTNFIVTRLKPGESTLGEDWVNVERQSSELTLTASGVNFTWAPKADDNYHLWGSTNGTNWGELAKFTETAGVYTAVVNLAKDTEFVFHLEKYADDDEGWRNFADLVGTGVSGNFKAKGGSGTDSNNIIVETGGEYTFTVTNEHKIQVGGTAPTPTPSTNYYVRGTAVGSWDVAEANKLLAPLENTQIGYISNLHLDVGEFVIANSDYSAKWGYKLGEEKSVIGGAAANFSEGASDNNIKCDVAGNYDIYLMKNNYISVESHATPIPENTVWGKKGTADWGAIATVSENSFTLSGLAVGDMFSVHLTGDTWLNYDNLTGTLATNFVARGGSESPKDIKVATAGNYTFHVEGNKLRVGDPLSTKSVQFTLSGVPTVATGSSVYLVGTNSGWAAVDTYKLTKDGSNWVGTFTFDLGDLGYKFVIADGDHTITSWEKEGSGNERTLAITNDTTAQELTWGTYGGSEVVYTIYFTDYSKNWGENVYLHSWDSNNTSDTTVWPGTKMTYVGTATELNGGYTYSLVLPSTHDRFIITNDDDGTGGKSDRVDEKNVSDYLSSTNTKIGFYYHEGLQTYNPDDLVIG